MDINDLRFVPDDGHTCYHLAYDSKNTDNHYCGKYNNKWVGSTDRLKCENYKRDGCFLGFLGEKAEKEAKEKAEREAKEKEAKERAEREAWKKREKDEKETAEKYSKAAEQGDAEARFYLGLMYKEGKGVPRDFVKADELIKKAAAQNNVKAKEYLTREERERARKKRNDFFDSIGSFFYEYGDTLKRIGHYSALVLQIIGIISSFVASRLDGASGWIGIWIVFIILIIIPFLVLFFASSIVKRIVLFILGIPIPLLFFMFGVFSQKGGTFFFLLSGIVILVSNIIALICPKED